ncbi:MAG: endonuclease [Bacteroidia bacterium]
MEKNIAFRILFLIFGMNCVNSMAQMLSTHPSQILMGDVYETMGDSALVWVKNTSTSAISISEVRTYPDPYGNIPYSISMATPFSIPANDSVSFYVKCKPIHNVLHNSEIVLIPSAPMGAIAIDVKMQGKYSNPYYNSTQNLVEQALKDALNTKLTQTLTGLTYSIARDKMFMEIDNQKFNGQGATQNTLECIYTGRQAVGYTSRTDCQANHSFNTEHTFPQSLFSSNLPMLADLHHIFPTDDNANSVRGNNPFNNIQGSGTWTQGGSVSNGSSFEPRDAQKGRSARALMYFSLKYQDYSCFVQGQESILRQWHIAFPPDNIEKLRNSAIATAQGNRNPFIDYPQFIQRINKITSCNGNSMGAPSVYFDYPKDSINYGDVPISTLQQHRFALLNLGEDTIHVSNLSVGAAEIEFNNPTLSIISLIPGEVYYLVVDLTLQSLGAFQSYIRISPDVMGAPYLEIPVTANGINNTSNDLNNNYLVWGMYPNPSTSKLTITSLAGGEIEVLDLQGKTLAHYSLSEGKETLDLSQLSEGLYMIKASLDGKSSVKKWWKN